MVSEFTQQDPHSGLNKRFNALLRHFPGPVFCENFFLKISYTSFILFKYHIFCWLCQEVELQFVVTTKQGDSVTV